MTWSPVRTHHLQTQWSFLRYAVPEKNISFTTRRGEVVAEFAGQMLQAQPVTIHGDGQQARDFVFVGDVSATNLACLRGGSGQVYNIGTGVRVTIEELFSLLRSLTASGRDPIRGPARRGDVYRIALDCRKAESEIGWRPPVRLEGGLRSDP